MTYSQQMVNMYRKQAKKYKTMSLSVQRANAIEFALYYRKLVKVGC